MIDCLGNLECVVAQPVYGNEGQYVLGLCQILLDERADAVDGDVHVFSKDRSIRRALRTERREKTDVGSNLLWRNQIINVFVNLTEIKKAIQCTVRYNVPLYVQYQLVSRPNLK